MSHSFTGMGQANARVASTASAASLTLPAAPLIATYPITGTTTINDIFASQNAKIVILEFVSAGCQVTSVGNIDLIGNNFISSVGRTLTLESDGSIWREVCRGGVILSDLPLIKEQAGTSTASASSITLPTNGNLVTVTGTTMINTITATGNAGRVVTLTFPSVGCRIGSVDRGSGGNIYTGGPFYSRGSSTLTAYCDGTNWIEQSRSGSVNPYVIASRTASVAMAVGYNSITLPTEIADPYGLFTANTSGLTVTSDTAGVWLFKITGSCDAVAGGQRVLFAYHNFSVEEALDLKLGTASYTQVLHGSKIVNLGNTGTFSVMIYTDVICNCVAANYEAYWLGNA
jgi:hypothetical protein